MKKGIQIVILLVLLQTGVTTLNAQYQDHRIRRIDTLERILAVNPPTGEGLARVYADLMWDYLSTDKEKSMDYARKCIETSVSLDAWQYASESFRIIGMHFWASTRYDSAMVYFDKAMNAIGRMRDFSKYTEKDIDDCFSKVYGSIGNLYNIQGQNLEAVEYYQKALVIFERYGWKRNQALAFYNIGEMYLTMHNYEQAELNYSKSDVIAHEIGDTLLIAYSKRGLSQIFLYHKDYEKALENANIAYDYFFTHPEETQFKVSILNVLADVYLTGHNNARLAERYVRQALQITDSLDIQPVEKSASLALLSAVYLKRGEWRKAGQTALEALATDDSEPANTLALYEILVKVYGRLGNSDKAWEYFDKHNTLQSSWATKHYQSAIREMEVKYETGKKETQIATLETEKRLMMWLGIAGGGMLLLGLAVSLLLWRTTSQKKRHAEQQINQLEQEKQLVAMQALLDGEIQERARLARDLHDGLGSMLTGCKMNIEGLKNDVIHGKLEVSCCDHAISLLNNSTQELRRIAHHLMPDTLTRFGLKTSVGDFCSALPNVNFTWYGNDARLEPKMEAMIYRTLYELVNNALKHARASQILVQIIQEPARIAFTVQDDGCGFNPSAETKGMGLRNIRTRITSFGGMMNIQSGNEGTEVNVELKIEN